MKINACPSNVDGRWRKRSTDMRTMSAFNHRRHARAAPAQRVYDDVGGPQDRLALCRVCLCPHSIREHGQDVCLFITAILQFDTQDSMLPKNATYGGIEYAPTPAKLQALLDELTPGQFAVLGFSAGCSSCCCCGKKGLISSVLSGSIFIAIESYELTASLHQAFTFSMLWLTPRH